MPDEKIHHKLESESHREACLVHRKTGNHARVREHRHAAGEHALAMSKHCKTSDDHLKAYETIHAALRLYATKDQIVERGEKVCPIRKISKDTAANEPRIKELSNACGYHALQRRLAGG